MGQTTPGNLTVTNFTSVLSGNLYALREEVQGNMPTARQHINWNHTSIHPPPPPPADPRTAETITQNLPSQKTGDMRLLLETAQYNSQRCDYGLRST